MNKKNIIWNINKVKGFFYNPHLPHSWKMKLDKIIKNNWLIRKIVDYGKEPLIETLIRNYCVGKGMEIGPGNKPYCTRKKCIYLDKSENSNLKIDIKSDASEIPMPNNSFDFLLSSHCLEHCSDTLKTLYEWKRVVKPRGIIFLILPHIDRTYDKGRSLTTLNHNIKDFKQKVKSIDKSHWKEIKKVYMKKKEKINKCLFWAKAGNPWKFSLLGKNNRIHYHVWTQNEMVDILKYINLKILYVVDDIPERHDSFLIIAKV